MAKVPMKGLHIVRSKGKTYYYAWRGGPRIAEAFGSPAFHAAFADSRNPLADLDRRRLNAWVTLYKASDEYSALSDTTKRLWSPWFDQIKDEFGDLSVRQFDRPKIRVDIRRWLKRWKDRPRAADTGKQVLSRVLSYVVAEGGISLNPCEGIPNIYSCNRADIIWEAHHLDQLFASASTEIINATKLATYTGLRLSDLLKLSWSHIGENAIEFKTGKSRGRRAALIPITRELRLLLKSLPRKSTTVLVTSRGTPWRGFGSSWDKAMKDCGLSETELHFHDLRGTAATNFYRAGFTTREIAQTLAWSEEKVERIIDRYVKRDEIIRDRIRRMDKAQHQ